MGDGSGTVEGLVIADYPLTGLAGKRVLVTGAAGFIGGHLTRRLVAEGAHVTACVLTGSDQGALADVADRVSFHVLDIGDADAVRRSVASIQPQIVFHLAAVGMSEPCPTWQAAVRVNVEGTRNLLEAAHQANVQRFVHTGTAYEHSYTSNSRESDPLSIYARSKVAASEWAQRYARDMGLPVVKLRLFAVYGPGQPPQSLVPGAVLAALAGRDFPMTPGEQERDFIFVRDVVEGYLRVATSKVQGAAIDLGTGHACAVREAVTQVFKLTGSPARPLIGALPYRAGEIMRQVANTQLARELLGWQAATSLEDGLRQTIEWYRQPSANYA